MGGIASADPAPRESYDWNVLVDGGKRKLQGIFCSDREGLPDTIVGIFEALVKKVLDIDHARGIILGSSSDIDGLVVDCLAAHFNKNGDVLSDDARKIIAERLKKITKRFEKNVTAIAEATRVNDLVELHDVYTSIDRLNLLRKVLEAGGNHSEQCVSMKNYAGTTVPKRNIVAHVRVTRDGFSRKLIDKNNKEFTSDEIKQLLLSLLMHQEIFEQLIKQLKGN